MCIPAKVSEDILGLSEIVLVVTSARPAIKWLTARKVKNDLRQVAKNFMPSFSLKMSNAYHYLSTCSKSLRRSIS